MLKEQSIPLFPHQLNHGVYQLFVPDLHFFRADFGGTYETWLSTAIEMEAVTTHSPTYSLPLLFILETVNANEVLGK